MKQFKDFFTHESEVIVKIAHLLEEGQQALNQGTMTRSEFDELVNDLTELKQIDEQASDIEMKVHIQQAIEAIKLIASSIP